MNKPTPAERSAALNKIRRQWKTAEDIRFEGKCPSCKRRGLWSLTLPEYDSKRVNKAGLEEEHCGYFCTLCGWGNAGSRPVESDELDDE